MMRLGQIIAAVVIAAPMVVGISAVGAAGQYEDGKAAYHAGDYNKALRLWRPLAERGVANAQYYMGAFYHLGLGVTQNFAKAQEWYHKAAKQGHGLSMVQLGTISITGTGVEQDNAAAAKWYKQAAEHGEVRGQIAIGNLNRFGRGVPKNLVRAHMWYAIAAASEPENNPNVVKKLEEFAADYRDKVAQEMTPAQIAEAEKMAREWMAKHGK